MPGITIRNVDAGYGVAQVLWEVSLEVPRGSVVALIGPNGAGKTTILRTVAGLLIPWRGTILLENIDITKEPPHRRVDLGLVLVPEGRQLWPRMTVEENLLLGAYRPRLRARAQENLHKVYEIFPRLAERRRQLAGTLSGGEQQMVAIGRGLMAEPKYLLLDEPSLGLAPRIVSETFEIIRAIARTGVTILLVEQAVTNALAIADYAYVLETGRLVTSGPAHSIREDEHVKQAYLGITSESST